MRTLLSALIALISLATLGKAQLSCRSQTTTVPVRAGGAAELTADLVVTCTGGTPTRVGANVPKYQFLVTANTVIASKSRQDPGSNLLTSEALLLVGEPAPATQVAGGNVFQGMQFQGTGVVFQGIPIDPPGKDASLIIRITNLRVNTLALLDQAAGLIKMSVQVYSESGASVALSGGELVVGNIQSPLTFSLATALDANVLPTAPALTITPSALPTTLPVAGVGFHLKFTEGFPGAFKRRNIGTSGSDPSFLVSQNVPGTAYRTETGFFNSLFPVTGSMNLAGLADSGTRLTAVLQKIPEGTLVWVSTRDVTPGTTNYLNTSPKALLTYTDSLGAGPFTYSRANTTDGYAQLPVSNGSATATWEVVSSNADSAKTLSFSVALTGALGTPVSLGTATVSTGLSPHASSGANVVAALPSFSDTAVPRAAFTLSNTTAVPALTMVPAGSFTGPSVAPDSIVAAFGASLAANLASADSPQISLGGTTVDVIDSNGDKRSAQIFAIAPTQINFILDPATKNGLAVVNANYQGRVVASGLLQVESVAPSLFSANGDGRNAAAGQLVRVRNGQQSIEPLASFDSVTNQWLAVPTDLGPASDSVYLVLYGTGIRKRANINTVSAALGGAPIPVLFAGPHTTLIGVDQINLGPIPRELVGHGNVNLALTVEGKGANQLILTVK